MSSEQHPAPSAAQAKTQAKILSNRTFGLIFAGIFSVIALLPMLSKSEPRVWALVIAGLFTLFSLAAPKLLAPLNRAWNRFGQFMHKIVNPLLMGLIFVLTIIPTALIIRLLGKDPMRRKLEPKTSSYWIKRDTPITKESFDNQF